MTLSSGFLRTRVLATFCRSTLPVGRQSAAAALCALTLSCTSGGVGDPCTPEDEYDPNFGSFSVGEVQIERRSLQCETRVCLVNHFQGRVSCPYGQTESEARSNAYCSLPGDASEKIVTEVAPQLIERQAADAVYCSCRCDGPDKNARYCECPSGYECAPLDVGVNAPSGVQGSYCIRSGTAYDPAISRIATCDRKLANCN